MASTTLVGSNPPGSADGGAAAALRHRVSLYLARVVKSLADYEDSLLKEDGFFARSEHFEAQVDSLRGEFEANERAQTVFADPEAVRLLIGQLNALVDPLSAEPTSARRRLQFAFAASVLLTSSISVGTMLRHPELLQAMWGLVKQPVRLNPTQLQYWCRCAGCVLLTHRAAAADLHGDSGLLRALLCHLYSDSVCMLVRCLLGLPCVVGGKPSGPAVVPFSVALGGDDCALVRGALRVLLRSEECAPEVCALVVSICEALPEQPDALELAADFSRAIRPYVPSLLAAVVGEAHAPSRAHASGTFLRPASPANVGAVAQLLGAALQMEQRCATIAAEQLECFEVETVATVLGIDASAAPPLGSQALSSSSIPGALAPQLLPLLPALSEAMRASRGQLQLRLLELLVVFAAVAPPELHAAVVEHGVPGERPSAPHHPALHTSPATETIAATPSSSPR